MAQSPAPQFSGIFVSYRRDDSSGHAGRLFDKLVDRFGKDRIFMDVDTIEPGEDFVTVIENAVGSCDILLAIIGRNWLSGTGRNMKQVDNSNDFVRLEIGTALKRDIRVIPVLVQRASMPKPQDLPDDLAKLARRNAIELTDLRWQTDVEQLITVMERVLAKREEATRLAEAVRQDEEERRRREDQENQRAEEERVRLAEEEAKRRAAEERLLREDKARREEERARLEAQEASQRRAVEIEIEALRRTEEAARSRVEAEQEAEPRLPTEEEQPEPEPEPPAITTSSSPGRPAQLSDSHARDNSDATSLRQAKHKRQRVLALIAGASVLAVVAALGIPALVTYQRERMALRAAIQNLNQRLEKPTAAPKLELTAEGNSTRGDTLFLQDKYAEAELYYREALRLQPDSASYRRNVSTALRFQGKSKAAEPYANEALSMDRKDPKNYNEMGLVLRAQDKNSEAEQYFREAVRLSSNDAAYHNNLGLALYDQRKYAEAEAEYREAIRLNPDNASYQENLKKIPRP